MSSAGWISTWYGMCIPEASCVCERFHRITRFFLYEFKFNRLFLFLDDNFQIDFKWPALTDSLSTFRPADDERTEKWTSYEKIQIYCYFCSTTLCVAFKLFIYFFAISCSLRFIYQIRLVNHRRAKISGVQVQFTISSKIFVDHCQIPAIYSAWKHHFIDVPGHH